MSARSTDLVLRVLGFLAIGAATWFIYRMGCIEAWLIAGFTALGVLCYREALICFEDAKECRSMERRP